MIKRWINGTMASCSCVVVLIGYQTATRPWVKYEIERGWNEGKGQHALRQHARHTSIPLRVSGGDCILLLRKSLMPMSAFYKEV